MEEINDVLLKMKDISYGYFYEGKDISESEDLPKYYTLNTPEKTIKEKWEYVGIKLS